MKQSLGLPNLLDLERGPAHALLEGLQDVLATLSAAVTLPACAEVTPAGFCARFTTAFTTPSPGKLLNDFLLPAAHDPTWPCPPALRDYLEGPAAAQEGYLSRLCRLRNRYAHPQQETPAEVLEEASAVLARVPLELPDWQLSWDEDGDVRLEGPVSTGLSPFLVGTSDGVVVFNGFAAPNALTYPKPVQPSEKFSQLWRSARLRDRALADPTWEEFTERAKVTPSPLEGSPPWWLKHVPDKGPPGFLVPPTLGGQAVSAVAQIWPAATCIWIESNADRPMGERISRQLGFGVPVGPASLARLLQGAPLVLGLSAAGWSSRQVLDLLRWTADLAHAPGADGIRILIERSAAELEGDHEKLWDRLPEDIGSVMRRPQGVNGSGLLAFHWPEARPRRFGLF